MRPRCCFLYFTFLGINMALFFLLLGRRFAAGFRRAGFGRRGWLSGRRRALVFHLLLPGGLRRSERRDNRSRFSGRKIWSSLHHGSRGFRLSQRGGSRWTTFATIPKRWPPRLRIVPQ